MTIKSRARLAWSAAALLAGVALSSPAQAVCVDNRTPFTVRLETYVWFFGVQAPVTTMLPPNQRTCVPRKEPLYTAALEAQPYSPMKDKDGQRFYSTGSTSYQGDVVTNNTSFRVTHIENEKPRPGAYGVVSFYFCRDC